MTAPRSRPRTAPADGASPTAEAPDGAVDPVEALQNALRGEHAAVYGYAWIGARSEGAQKDRCYRHLDAHRAQRDALRQALVDRNTEPAPAEAAYTLPESDSEDDLSGYARELERTSRQGALQLAGVPASPLREMAATDLQAAVVRSLEWDAGLRPFPGYDDEQKDEAPAETAPADPGD
ncbi:ferritin-like domain-containing protein [Nocardiopsis coralliicola]